MGGLGRIVSSFWLADLQYEWHAKSAENIGILYLEYKYRTVNPRIQI